MFTTIVVKISRKQMKNYEISILVVYIRICLVDFGVEEFIKFMFKKLYFLFLKLFMFTEIFNPLNKMTRQKKL